jgi:hypothetical protein
MHSIGVFAVAAASLLSVASAILANAASYPYDINGKLLNDRSLRERAGKWSLARFLGPASLPNF